MKSKNPKFRNHSLQNSQNSYSTNTNFVSPYTDLIHHPRPVIKGHPSMPRSNRAAQFAPFAALRGHNQLIVAEEKRATSNSEQVIQYNDTDFNDLEFDHLTGNFNL